MIDIAGVPFVIKIFSGSPRHLAALAGVRVWGTLGSALTQTGLTQHLYTLTLQVELMHAQLYE